MKKRCSSCCSCSFRASAVAGSLFYVVLGAGFDTCLAQDIATPPPILEGVQYVVEDDAADSTAEEAHGEAILYTALAGDAGEPVAASLDVAAMPALIWKGGVDGVWQSQETAESSNWQDGPYSDGRPVQFDDSSSQRDITLSDTVAPGSIVISADNATETSGTGSAVLNYGYSFNGPGSIADYTDSNGNIRATSLTLEGAATAILNTANTFSGGIFMGADTTLYIGCDYAAGSGAISMANGSELLVNYHSSDAAYRAPELRNRLDITGNVTISTGTGSYGEDRVPTDWRTLNLTGGLSGDGELWLYGYSYMVMPTDYEAYQSNGRVAFNYVSSFAINEKQAVSAPGETPERFTGTVRLLNEFNHRTKGNHEGSVADERFLCGAVQLVLVDDVFSEACLDLTRDNPRIRDAGNNKYKYGDIGKALTSDNILVLSESSHITIQSLEAEFLGKGWNFSWEKDNQQTTTALGEGKFPKNDLMKQADERWAVRVVTDGITNLVLEDNSSDEHIFSGSMGFAHSYTRPTEAYIDLSTSSVDEENKPANPASFGDGSLGVEMLSLEKRGLATQYIHSANLVNLSVMDGILGFNNLSVSGALKLAGSSVLKLGVTGIGVKDNPWDYLSGITNTELTVGGGLLEVSATKQPGRITLPTQAIVEGSLTLADSGAGTNIVFDINSVMPSTGTNYVYTLLDVSDTLTVFNSTNITLNFSNVNLAEQYDPELTYYLASADAIVVNTDAGNPNAAITGRNISLGSGYYGELDIQKKDGRDYLVMNVVGDPRRTWSGMLSGSYEGVTANYIWQNSTTQSVDDADHRWKENRNYEDGLLVLFGNLYEPVKWDGISALNSIDTVNVTTPLHDGNVVLAGEEGFAIDGVEDAAVGYQKVQIVGRVAPASIVIGADFNLNDKNTDDATNYYFYGSGYIDEAQDSELNEAFQGGTTSLRKMGDGTAVLATDNSFTGGTVLEGGRIVMQHKNALGTGEIYIVNGSFLQADFADNKAEYAHLHAFKGEQMETTVIQNTVRTSVYVDPSNADYDALVDARLGNAHDKKMVLTTLAGDTDTVVTLYGFSHKTGQYSYAVFKVLNPDNFHGTVRMDGNFQGTTDPDAAGGKVQLEIMTVDKAQDASGGNWLNANIDLSVEHGTERTVLALDALGTATAGSPQIAQVNSLIGGGNSGARINSSVVNMSHEKAITLQILGTIQGDYDGVLGFGDFQKTVQYEGTPTDIGHEKHHYGRHDADGELNVLKEGNATQSVNSAWLNELTIQGGHFVVDEALVLHSLDMMDETFLVVGDVGLTYPHALVVGKGGVLAMDNDATEDAFAGVGAGIGKTKQELINPDGSITLTEIAPSAFVLLADGATIAGHGDWFTDYRRTENINGEDESLEVRTDIVSGATVTVNTHNFNPDASINEENDEFNRYGSSHAIRLLGEMAGKDVHLIFNNEQISAAAQAAGDAQMRDDGLGYEGETGPMVGYAAIRDIHQFTGDINVKSMTVLQVRDANSSASETTADIAVTVAGGQAGIQFTDGATKQYMNQVTLRDGGHVLLGGSIKETTDASGVMDMTGVDAAVTNNNESDASVNNLHLENSGTMVSLGGTDTTPSLAKNVAISSMGTTEAMELHDMSLRLSLVDLHDGCSLDVKEMVHIYADSVIAGSNNEQPSARSVMTVSSKTTLELTPTAAPVVSTTEKGTKIAQVSVNQLQNVDVRGDGLTLVLSGDGGGWEDVNRSGASFVGVQISGAGSFLFEEEGLFTDGVLGDGINFTLLDAAGQDVSALWVTSGFVSEYIGGGYVADNNMLWFAVVPEPSTATLSLLALSMLAIRRRRRK